MFSKSFFFVLFKNSVLRRYKRVLLKWGFPFSTVADIIFWKCWVPNIEKDNDSCMIMVLGGLRGLKILVININLLTFIIL